MISICSVFVINNNNKLINKQINNNNFTLTILHHQIHLILSNLGTNNKILQSIMINNKKFNSSNSPHILNNQLNLHQYKLSSNLHQFKIINNQHLYKLINNQHQFKIINNPHHNNLPHFNIKHFKHNRQIQLIKHLTINLNNIKLLINNNTSNFKL